MLFGPQPFAQKLQGVKGPLTASFHKDGVVYFLNKGAFYWKAKTETSGDFATGKERRNVFVDFFGCPKKGSGACVGGACNSSPTMAPAAATALLAILLFAV